jgi:hypothetical protein
MRKRSAVRMRSHKLSGTVGSARGFRSPRSVLAAARRKADLTQAELWSSC